MWSTLEAALGGIGIFGLIFPATAEAALEKTVSFAITLEIGCFVRALLCRTAGALSG